MYKITGYRFGELKIGGTVYTRDVIIMSGKGVIEPNWWREQGHHLEEIDLRVVIENKPETIVIGTGAYGMMKVTDNLINEFERRRIKVIVARTERACEIYNDLCEKGTKIIAALHLTC